MNQENQDSSKEDARYTFKLEQEGVFEDELTTTETQRQGDVDQILERAQNSISQLQYLKQSTHDKIDSSIVLHNKSILDDSQGLSQGDPPQNIDLSAISKDLQPKTDKESFEQMNKGIESDNFVNNEESRFFENVLENKKEEKEEGEEC